MSLSWFRRRRRPPPPVVLPALDRLAELVERVIALLDHTALSPEADQPEPLPPVAGHVLFAPSAEGYRLFERDGEAPAPGSELEVGGERFRVLRAGASPFPDDPRRCVFLEREEPSVAERTLDG